MLKRRGESVLFYEMVMMRRLVVMLVYKPEMASAVAGWPIGGTDVTSFWKAAAAAAAMPIEISITINTDRIQ